ncbi:hypothetical protein CALCODRAFT_353803 [Calocera cornea HHB12733]|uniref:Uncharacterized protein n=1 Tax=Calocera cornea HHB12733 TaxID=1353952 RepID=A0A165ES92_9BASI|nr:hypothetical protein CALCODRAFT_353803 [Calocera cornea HHB12733]
MTAQRASSRGSGRSTLGSRCQRGIDPRPSTLFHDGAGGGCHSLLVLSSTSRDPRRSTLPVRRLGMENVFLPPTPSPRLGLILITARPPPRTAFPSSVLSNLPAFSPPFFRPSDHLTTRAPPPLAC